MQDADTNSLRQAKIRTYARRSCVWYGLCDSCRGMALTSMKGRLSTWLPGISLPCNIDTEALNWRAKTFVSGFLLEILLGADRLKPHLPEGTEDGRLEQLLDGRVIFSEVNDCTQAPRCQQTLQGSFVSLPASDLNMTAVNGWHSWLQLAEGSSSLGQNPPERQTEDYQAYPNAVRPAVLPLYAAARAPVRSTGPHSLALESCELAPE